MTCRVVLRPAKFLLATILLGLLASAQLRTVNPPSTSSASAKSRELPANGGAAHNSKKHLGTAPSEVIPELLLPVTTYSSGGTTLGVATADLNGDGKADVVTVNASTEGDGTVAVLLGNGDGTFRPVVTYDSGGQYPDTVAIADVNGDGRLDIVVGDFWDPSVQRGLVGVLLGNGDGTFRPVVTYDSGGVAPSDVAIADVNRDGALDLVVSNCAPSGAPGCPGGAGDGNVAVLLGNGDGTFRAAVPYAPGGYATGDVAVVDVNGDGKPDIIVVNGYSCMTCTDSNVGVLLGNGDGTFRPVVLYTFGDISGMGLVVGDVNGDHKLDLVLVGTEIAVLLGNGDGTFQSAIISNPTPSYIGAGPAVIVDFDGDGKKDLVVSNWCDWIGTSCQTPGSVGILLGQGDGSFQQIYDFDSGGYSDGVAVADFNGDGRPDVAVANYYYDTVGVLLNNTGALLHTTTALASSPNPSYYGETVTLTAVVSASSGVVTGAVAFFDGSTAIGSASLANGQANLALSSLTAGSHPFTAQYQGTASYYPSSSAQVDQVIDIVATTTSLRASPNPAHPGQVVKYLATVTNAYGETVTGLVTFQDGTTTVATEALVKGQALYRTTYASGGSHQITASYLSDGNFGNSTSAVVTENINSVSKTVVTTSGSPSQLGQLVVFTATVTSKFGAIPNGEPIAFYDGQTLLGSVPLNSGVATYSTSSLTAKSHVIKAKYAGDSSYRPSKGSVKQLVQK